MRILTFEGSPRAMGQAFGESCRDEIHAFYRKRLQNAVSQVLHYGERVIGEADFVAAGVSCLGPTRAYDPIGFDELTGIAEGADMPVEKVLAMNGLTDLRDVLSWPAHDDAEGCSSFVIAASQTKAGRLLCGQTWDLATDNLPFVLAVHRKPDEGPETRCLTTVGCLSLIGLNSAGIAVGTTNIRTTDARPGVTYLSIIHRALRATRYEDAIEAVTGAHRAGAHYYYVADGAGRAAALECTARTVSRHDLVDESYVHANHCLVEANTALQGPAPSPSSLHRQARLEGLVTGGAGGITVADAMGFMGDTDGGEDAICRDDFAGINTNGAVVMSPQTGEIWACHGLPRAGAWVALHA